MPPLISPNGIIPACAGSTGQQTAKSQLHRDHPRMRGEHQDGRRDAQDVHGIIPACAGSTGRASCTCSAGWDHPRMRGEHTAAGKAEAVSEGSSPHARGARRLRVPELREAGIIPACAGSTALALSVSIPARDHPRMRGEHRTVEPFQSCTSGSSPHARGALDARPVDHEPDGIIPACAGSTGPWGRPGSAGRDHPRMRGEHASVNTGEV